VFLAGGDSDWVTPPRPLSFLDVGFPDGCAVVGLVKWFLVLFLGFFRFRFC